MNRDVGSYVVIVVAWTTAVHCRGRRELANCSQQTVWTIYLASAENKGFRVIYCQPSTFLTTN